MKTIEWTTETVAERLRQCMPRLAPHLTGESVALGYLALDSMDTVELLCVIHEEFDVRLTDGDLDPGQSIGAWLRKITFKANEP
jgi:acyl carrier protein